MNDFKHFNYPSQSKDPLKRIFTMSIYNREAAPVPQGPRQEWFEFIESKILDLDDHDLEGYWDEGLCKEEVVELIEMEIGL